MSFKKRKLETIERLSKEYGLSSSLKYDKLFIQYIDETLSSNQREIIFNPIINECHQLGLMTRFLTCYDDDPKEVMLKGETMLEIY